MEPTQTLVINRLILSPPFHPNLDPYSCRKKKYTIPILIRNENSEYN